MREQQHSRSHNVHISAQRLTSVSAQPVVYSHSERFFFQRDEFDIVHLDLATNPLWPVNIAFPLFVFVLRHPEPKLFCLFSSLSHSS